MPQYALSETKNKLIAWELPPETFHSKGLPGLICPECSSAMYPRVSKYGFQHFVHKRAEDCPTAEESELHLLYKSIIASTAEASNWQAIEEYSKFKDSRPDVLCISPDGRYKVAFEVQLASITHDGVLTRTDRHQNNGIVRTVWVASKNQLSPRPWAKRVPMLHLRNLDYRDLQVEYDSLDGWREVVVTAPLAQVVSDILNRRIRAHPLTSGIRESRAKVTLGLPQDHWIFSKQEDFDAFTDKVKLLAAVEEAQQRKRSPTEAARFADALIQGTMWNVARDRAANIIRSSAVVPDECDASNSEYTFLRYGSDRFIVVDDAEHRINGQIYRVSAKVLELLAEHPDYILVNGNSPVGYMSDSTSSLRFRVMGWHSLVEYLDGKFVLE